ncbi:hypothetical protein BDN72DRAFT_906141, partial [Pluteus cervinus]
YYQRYADLGRNYKYLPASPQIFRIGDLVEAQFSLVVYKMKGENYVLKPMLYSIVLLDGQFADELVVLRANKRTPSVVSGTKVTKGIVLKRKIGYESEQEPDVQMRQEEEDVVCKKTRWSDSETPCDGRSPSSEQLNQLEKMNLDN